MGIIEILTIRSQKIRPNLTSDDVEFRGCQAPIPGFDNVDLYSSLPKARLRSESGHWPLTLSGL